MINISDDFLAKLAIAVMGECENCEYKEKVLIALVGLNRFISNELGFIKFFPLEKDFLGYNRVININNSLSRNAMEDSFKAVLNAKYYINSVITDDVFGEKDYHKIFFFNLAGEKPSTIYNVKKCSFDFKTKHTFWKIVEF